MISSLPYLAANSFTIRLLGDDLRIIDIARFADLPIHLPGDRVALVPRSMVTGPISFTCDDCTVIEYLPG